MKILHFVRSCATDHGAYYYLKKLEKESYKYNLYHYYLAYEKDWNHPNQPSLCPTLEEIDLNEYFFHIINPDIVHFHDVNSYYVLGKTSIHQSFYDLAFSRKCIRTIHDYSSIVCPMYFTEGEKHGECQSILSSNCIGKCLDKDTMDIYMKYIKSLNRYDCISYFSDDTEKRINLYNNLYVPKFKLPPLIAPLPLAQPKENVIVFSGRVIPQKGVHILLEALSQMKCQNWRLYIIGSKNAMYFRQLVKLTRKLDLVNKVIFYDHLPQEELYKIYKKTKVLAFPSISHETYGMSGAEAVAAGIPVVAFQIDGINEWLQDGVNGRIVERMNIDAYAAAMNEILTDDKVYNIYHKNAIKWRNMLDYQKQVSLLCDMYYSL